MGISRDSKHKRRLTGGKQPLFRKKRKFELGRQASMTKLGTKLVRPVRVRGGNVKLRALRLENGNFSWGSEAITRKTRILGVVYNASNNELVRTNTLVKGCVVQIDAAPFKAWHLQHYGVEVGKKKGPGSDATEEVKKSKSVLKKLAARAEGHSVDRALEDEFVSGRLFAVVSSRPGQSGRCDGYVLEGKELEFYKRQLQKKKKSGK
uniref:40S ribosomal protein S8 n=1 Tax=Timspurckia oligopyrenoides TaxID=708627 RepID=A0A7S1EQ05_9RHOD|mmetsp:Transcript_11793/g.21333  ORF Transcript_11793/g.21333 Transcript_11793/m.21333 type:complete len:207 (+) Transcript_11793:55-675(+)